MPSHLARYQAEWKELEALVGRASRGLGRLDPEELSRLDLLYRRAVVLLAQVGTRTTDRSLREYLNHLVGRAHGVLYLPPRRGPARRTLDFAVEGFARIIVRSGRFHMLAGGLLLLGMALAWIAVARDPAAAYALMPAGEFRLPGASREQLLDVLRYGRDEGHGIKFIFASSLFSHNFKVGLLSLGTGILAGIPAALLIVYNGMILGAFSAVHHGKGIVAEYWAWILPHGITELLAITLFGGCGLRLGWTWIHPGWRTRGEALRRAAGDVAATCAGAGAMLIFAAIVESYLRQSHLPIGARLFFAAVTAAFWVFYFVRGARLERRLTAE
jgi:uncharacterized membrane protein SpoIIM required for sporulation